MVKSILGLLASEAVALVAWGSSLPNWDAALLTENFFPGLGIFGGVLLAWLGQSPIKYK